MTISLTSRTISTRSPAIVEPGIAESGWTNRDRERVRPVFGSLVPEHSCAKACYILTIQLISCSEMRKKSSLSVTWKTRLYSQQEPKLWRVNFWCHNLLQMSSKVLDLLESFVLIKKNSPLPKALPLFPPTISWLWLQSIPSTSTKITEAIAYQYS